MPDNVFKIGLCYEIKTDNKVEHTECVMWSSTDTGAPTTLSRATEAQYRKMKLSIL